MLSPLSPLYERALDIIYKCFESRVAVVDDVSLEILCVMNAIISNFKCDCAKHVYDFLEYFVLKAGVEVVGKELKANVGYGFMISYLLKLKRNCVEAKFRGLPTHLLVQNLCKEIQGSYFYE